MKAIIFLLLSLFHLLLPAQTSISPDDPRPSRTFAIKTDVFNLLNANVNLDIERYLGKRWSITAGLGSLSALSAYNYRRDIVSRGAGMKVGVRWYLLNRPDKQRVMEGFALEPVLALDFTQLERWRNSELQTRYGFVPRQAFKLTGALLFSYQKLFFRRLSLTPAIGVFGNTSWYRERDSGSTWQDWSRWPYGWRGFEAGLAGYLNVGFVF